MNKKLHIVSFDVPYPPDYGGIVDVFFKIKSLHRQGAEIYLHLFEYGRERRKELNEYCVQVFYYGRSRSVFDGMRLTPFIVQSRASEELIKNIKAIQAPVLFEGLHTTYPLAKGKLDDRKSLVRMHNVEHRYYSDLARNESSLFKKLYFKIESAKLKRYEKVLAKTDHVLSISPAEQEHFSKIPHVNSSYLPAFHPNSKMSGTIKKGYFALYHGNLAVKDNLKAARTLAELFKKLRLPFLIAGNTEDKKLLTLVDQTSNLQYIPLKDTAQLVDLIRRAQLNIFMTDQRSGVKLKLLNALFNGRFCLVNPPMVEGSGLEDLCVVARNKEEMTREIIRLMDEEFTEEEFSLRRSRLSIFDNASNAGKVMELIRE